MRAHRHASDWKIAGDVPSIPTVGLARSWLGASARVAAVTLLAPVALVAAVAILAVGNGLGGLGALRQAIAGPTRPSADAAPAALQRPALAPTGPAVTPELRTRPPVVAAPSSPTTVAPHRRSGARSPGAATPPAVAPTPTAQSPAPPGSSSPAQGGAPSSGGGGGGGPQSPSSSPPKGPVGQAVQPVRDTVGQLPVPVGPTGGQVLDTVTGALDGVLAPGTSAPPTGSGTPSLPVPPAGGSALPGLP